MSRAAPSLALALALLAAGCGGSKDTPGITAATAPSSEFKGAAVEGPPVTAPNFALRDQDGKLVTLAAQRGRSVVVAFLYTTCPDVCPIIAGNLNQALRKLGPKRKDVRILAVSVDPKNDTQAAVSRYVKKHRLLPEFRFLTGTEAQLQRVWTAYHVAVVANQKGDTVGHSSYEVLIDPGGTERVRYDAHVRAADVVHDVGVVAGG